MNADNRLKNALTKFEQFDEKPLPQVELLELFEQTGAGVQEEGRSLPQRGAGVQTGAGVLASPKL